MSESVSLVVRCLPLSKCLEIHLQNGSVFHICDKVSLQSSKKGGVAFTLVVPYCDGDGTSTGGIVSIIVFLQIQVAGPSDVDAASVLMKMLVAAGLLRTSTNQDRPSATLLHAPDIYLKVMLYMVSSSDHPFTLLFVFLPLRRFCKGLWSLHIMMSDP